MRFSAPFFVLFCGLVVSACVAEPDVGSDAYDVTGGWSCRGTVGKTENPTGEYYVTSFGCWIDEDGKHRGDPSDNCIPWCESGASKHGTQDQYEALCGGLSGPECERKVKWFAADADRFGCMSRIRVTNPDNDKSVVLVVLDRGPHCKIERKVNHWVLDMSYPASNYLFGEPKSAQERADVIVEAVTPDTPLGPSDGPPLEQPDDEPPPPPPPAEDPDTIIVDSNNSLNEENAQCTVSSAWTSSSSVSGYYNTGYWWRNTGNSADPALFEAHLESGGTYAVDAWWPAAFDRSPEAPFLIYDAGDNLLETVWVNQQENGSQWVELGVYDFTPGWNTVALSRWADAGYAVIADAVRFRRL